MSNLSAVPCLLLLSASCAPQGEGPGPFARVEEDVWRAVNRSHTGDDGLFVQATFRTFAYEIATLYAQAEKAGLSQQHVESRLRELVYAFIDAPYPVDDGTDVNSLYFQYLIYVNPQFDPGNPLQKAQFDTWRAEYVRRLLGIVYERRFPLLRPIYDERWGMTLYSRLVFTVYLGNEEAELTPYIADIGERTFLVDEAGQRYAPSGIAGPYPYEFDRPRTDRLTGMAVYRVFYPNRQADRRTPILTAQSKRVELVVEGLGDVAERRLRWDLPLSYPPVPDRYLSAPEEPG